MENNKPIKLKDAIKAVFSIMTKNSVLGYLFKVGVLSFLAIGVVMIVYVILMAVAGGFSYSNSMQTTQTAYQYSTTPQATTVATQQTGNPAVVMVVSLLMGVTWVYVTGWFIVLGILVAINITKGELMPLKELMIKSLKLAPKLLLLTMFIWLGTTIGFVLLIIPGIIFTLKWLFAPFIMVEENTGVFEALKKSSDITKGYRMNLLGKGIGFFLFMILMLIPLMFLSYTAGTFGGQLATYFGSITLYVVYMSVKELKQNTVSKQPKEPKTPVEEKTEEKK